MSLFFLKPPPIKRYLGGSGSMLGSCGGVGGGGGLFFLFAETDALIQDLSV